MMEDDLSNEQFSNFQFDIKRWISKIKHLESEFLFIERQLTQTEGVSAKIMFDFRKKLVHKKETFKKLKSEIVFLQNKITENETNDVNQFIETHEFLDNGIEKFFNEMKMFKNRIMQRTLG